MTFGQFLCGTKASLNQPTFPMVLTIPARDSAGALRDLHIGLYKCQFKPLSFQGPSYKSGLMLDYNAKALVSDVR